MFERGFEVYENVLTGEECDVIIRDLDTGAQILRRAFDISCRGRASKR